MHDKRAPGILRFSRADIVGDNELHDKLIDDDFNFELRSRVGDLDRFRLSVETIKDRLHKPEKVWNFLADLRVSLDHSSKVFEMLLNVTGEFVRVIGTFSACQDSAMNARRMPAHRCESEVSSITDGPETDLIHTERFS